MRRALLSILAAVAVLAPLSIAPTPAGALPGFDVAVAVSDMPDPVTPVGGTTVYKVVASTTDPVSLISGTLTSSVTGGGSLVLAGTQVPASCTLPANGTVNPTVTCSMGAATANLTLYLAIKSSAAGTLTNTSTVSYSLAHGVVDDNPANDSDTETTTVSNSTSGSASYLQEGQSTTFQGHKLTVTDSDTGVITRLGRAPVSTTDKCGATTACKQGLRVEFFENQTYTGRVLVDVTFGSNHPCDPAALYPSCYYLYYRKFVGGPIVGMEKCATAASPTPCFENKFWASSAWHVTVRMDSSDPDLLSPVKPLTTGTA